MIPESEPTFFAVAYNMFRVVKEIVCFLTSMVKNCHSHEKLLCFFNLLPISMKAFMNEQKRLCVVNSYVFRFPWGRKLLSWGMPTGELLMDVFRECHGKPIVA